MDEEKKLDVMAWLDKFGVLSQITYEPVADDDLIRLDFGDDNVIIQANRNGFRSLANMVALFDRDTVPDGDHIHLDSGIILARDSLNLVVGQIWPIGSEESICADLPRPATKSDRGRVTYLPTPDACVRIDLWYNEIGIQGNRSGFRVLSDVLEQFDQSEIKVGESLHLRSAVDLPRESVSLTLTLIDETWLEHCAACLGHSQNEIADIRLSDELAKAAWEERVIREIEEYRARSGQIELPMPRKSGA